jgi:hypothetical protein
MTATLLNAAITALHARAKESVSRQGRQTPLVAERQQRKTTNE